MAICPDLACTAKQPMLGFGFRVWVEVLGDNRGYIRLYIGFRVSKNLEEFFGGPNDKGSNILGSILGKGLGFTVDGLSFTGWHFQGPQRKFP